MTKKVDAVNIRPIAAALTIAYAAAPLCALAVMPGETSAVSESHARIERAIAGIDANARELMARSGVPGMAIAVVYDGKLVFIKGYGVRNTATKQPITPDTVFELASVSKSVGASVVAREVARGVVKWSDPVARYLKSFTLHDPWVGSHVTIGDLYSHRSGLPDHAGDQLEDLGYRQAQILARLRYLPLQPFRISYNYTNYGLTAAAEAVARAAKTPWATLSSEAIYRPLGMTSTSSRFSDYRAAKNRADLHVRVDGVWKPLYVRDADPQSPAGGVSSTVRDMAKWLIFELGNGTANGVRLMPASVLAQTHQPQIVSMQSSQPYGRAQFYGYGMNVGYDGAGRLRLSHSGAFALGAGTNYLMLPSEHLGIVVLTNGQPDGLAESVAANFVDTAEFGAPQEDWYRLYNAAMKSMLADNGTLAGKTPPLHAAAALPASAYVGTYHNAYYGDATIAKRGNALEAILGTKHRSYPLRHWDGNTYSYAPVGEASTGIAAVTFHVTTGKRAASSVTFEDLNNEGIGTFTR